MSEPLLQVTELTKHFPIKGGLSWRAKSASVHAVDGVELRRRRGETLGLVGESGCGKTTTGRCILRLIEPTSGEVWFEGKDVTRARRPTRCASLRRDMQIIFQDPYASLNPRMTVGAIIGEALIIHQLDQTAQRVRRARRGAAGDRRPAAPTTCGAIRTNSPAASASASASRARSRSSPSSSSATSRSRRSTFRSRPRSSICSRICRKSSASTYLFIAHDLSVVEHISNRVAVMYLGRIVEIASATSSTSPRHPYTEALLSAVPIPDPKVKRQRIRLSGEVPNPISPPTGCHFHTRCPIAQFPLCKSEARRSSKAPTATGSPAISAEGSLREALFLRADPPMGPFRAAAQSATLIPVSRTGRLALSRRDREANSGLMRLR